LGRLKARLKPHGVFSLQAGFGSLMAPTRGSSKSALMPITILIADDYDDNRELLRLLLTAANYEVHEAKDGHECVLSAREKLPDLIMVDLSMPELDGWEVFKTLRSDSTTAHIPCVAVTAHTDLDCQRALKVGFDAFIPKPFRTDEMLATVARVVRGESSDSKLPSSQNPHYL